VRHQRGQLVALRQVRVGVGLALLRQSRREESRTLPRLDGAVE
jgi:hypothetical protein